jgi:heat shock protein HtpX
MRFFEQQRQSKAQTLRLVLLFAITLLMLVVALNAALAAAWWLVSWQTASYPA